mmetsp:Transcript_120149/g.340044  ORF Transcript_120149/g.340044 Transcript_120149/m.340044 type:complete len:429 (+) Transcript_120149:727-2013(+)
MHLQRLVHDAQSVSERWRLRVGLVAPSVLLSRGGFQGVKQELFRRLVHSKPQHCPRCGLRCAASEVVRPALRLMEEPMALLEGIQGPLIMGPRIGRRGRRAPVAVACADSTRRLICEVRQGERALSHRVPDFRVHHEVVGLAFAMEGQSSRHDALRLHDLSCLVALECSRRHHPPQVPEIKPRWRQTNAILHVNSAFDVSNRFVLPTQAAHDPAEIPVRGFPEFPSLVPFAFGLLCANDRLDLRQASEGVVRSFLFHPHRGDVVQSLEKPSATFFTAERQHCVHNSSGLIHLVVFQVRTDDIERRAQHLRVPEHLRPHVFGHVWAASRHGGAKCLRHDVVGVGNGFRVRHSAGWSGRAPAALQCGRAGAAQTCDQHVLKLLQFHPVSLGATLEILVRPIALHAPGALAFSHRHRREAGQLHRNAMGFR